LGSIFLDRYSSHCNYRYHCSLGHSIRYRGKTGTRHKDGLAWRRLRQQWPILFSFAIIDSSHAPKQWKTPYIYVLFIVGSLLLIVAGYVECDVISNPLLPQSLFRVPCMPALNLGLFFNYGSLGIFIYYATFYMEQIMGATPFHVVAKYVPFALGGCIIGTF